MPSTTTKLYYGKRSPVACTQGTVHSAFGNDDAPGSIGAIGSAPTACGCALA
jgi:hypothetical protein